MNRPSSSWVPASVRLQEPLSCPWACPLCPMGRWPWSSTLTDQKGPNELELERINPVVAEFRRPQDLRSLYHAHGNLIWSESAQWLPRSGVRKNPGVLITDSRSPYYGDGHAHVSPMGKLPWCFTCMASARFSGPHERTDGRTDEQTESIPYFPSFPSKKVGDNKQVKRGKMTKSKISALGL